MIALLEPLSEGPEHAPVNAALLEIVGLAYPDMPLAFHGSERHLAEVRAMLDEALVARTTWRPVALAPRRATFGGRALRDARLLRGAAADARGGVVLALQSIPSILFAAALGRRTGTIRVPVQALLHGYLNEAIGWRSRNPLSRATDMRSALSFAASAVTLIGMETGVKATMLEALPKVGARIVTLRHPLPLQTTTFAPTEFEVGAPLHFGFLGLATKDKGFDAFIDAARRLKPIHGASVEFHVIGRLPPTSSVDPQSLADVVATLPSTSSVPRAEYDARVAALHYACLPFDANHYTLSPSGSLLDALAHAKPVLVSATPTTRELFARGKPGALLDSPDGLCFAIEQLARTLTQDDYERQVVAMRDAREDRSPHRLAQDYAAFTGPLAEPARRDSGR